MPRALVLIRAQPHYRQEAFVTGLRACGYEVRLEYCFDPKPDDVVCAWNRYGAGEIAARQFEAAGATTICAENGYAGHEHGQPPKYYALARTAHGGLGEWHVGPEDRWSKLGIDLAPWRADNDGHILICPARGFGQGPNPQPANWADAIKAKLGTKRAIRVRQHPGNNAHPVPLSEDLKNCHAVVIWSSSIGVKALIAGVPVFYGAPKWICQQAARPVDPAHIEHPFLGDRLPALNAMAHAQWSCEELASGAPFRDLLRADVRQAA
jgi:hypothetical protein